VSSWGDGGAFEVRVNAKNDWMWKRIHDVRVRLGVQARRAHELRGTILERALQQATREVMLAQSSDWPFILTMGTQTGYATKRPVIHLSRAHRLLAGLEQGFVNEADLLQLEERDAVFADVDPGHFA
jgi:1,4-alpha-glucan branching enzyme